MSPWFLSHFAGFLVFFAIMMFVFFDGMDLGVGVLFPFLKNNKNRDIAMHTIHPFWDVNETWIIMAAIFIVTFFTRAYGIFISVFYIPVILLLGCVVLRGTAFELRSKNESHINCWNWVFFASSFAMSLVFGVFIGNLVVGINLDSEMVYQGTLLDLFNPVSLVSGVCAVMGFALIAVNWLILKTDGELLNLASELKHKIVKFLFISTAVLLLFIFLTDNLREIIMSSCIRLSIIAGLVILSYYILLTITKNTNQFKNLILSYIFALNGGIILISITYPYIVPRMMDISNPNFNMESQGFNVIMFQILLTLLVVLVYFFKNYHVFKGKITSAHSDIY